MKNNHPHPWLSLLTVIHKQGVIQICSLALLKLHIVGRLSPQSLALTIVLIFGIAYIRSSTHSVALLSLICTIVAFCSLAVCPEWLADQLLYPLICYSAMVLAQPPTKVHLLTIAHLFIEMYLSFPRQSFFENAIFAMTLGEALRSKSLSPLTLYLFRCIFAQVAAVGLLSFLRMHKQFRYYTLLLMNAVLGLYALKLGLHGEILDSDSIAQLLTLSVIGLISMIFVATFALKHLNLSNIVRRKIFHIPPLVLFPILDLKTGSLFLVALIGCFYVLVVLELLRQCGVRDGDLLGPQLKLVWDWMGNFIDHRDAFGWFTHLSLFAGTMISYFSPATNFAIRNASVIIPMGDAMAAIIGSKYGTIKVITADFPALITQIYGKTLEGYLAFVLTCFLLFALFSNSGLGVEISLSPLVAFAVVGAVELLTRQIDNLLLPALFLLLIQV